MTKINNDWDKILKNDFESENYKNILNFLDEEYKNYNIFPKKEEIFNALKLTSFEDTRVVIFGQDPYHEINQAHGLAFSVNDGVKIPPSLRNIYKEIKAEYGYDIPKTGNLIPWAKQGILLLNASLTVREGKPNSHSKIGWQEFTDNIIKHLNEKNESVIFMLWGNNARNKKKFITNPKHFILEATHPSPLSANRGFFGCNHFKKINEILKSSNKKEIDWEIK